MRYRIPATQDNVRTFKDPNGDIKRRIIVALVNLRDVPNFPLNPDPRVPKQGGSIVSTIKRSALADDGRFHEKNRGITVSVREAEYDNKAKILTLDIPEDEPSYGILDGGHTHYAIREAVAVSQIKIGYSDLLASQFVRLEVMVGVEEELAAIAGARNFSAQLKSSALSAYEGKFDWLKEALGEKSQYVEYRENEEQPVPVMEVGQALCAVNLKMHPDEESIPIEAYNNAAKCLNAFVADGDPNDFRAFAPIALDIVRLYDYIRLHWDKVYDEKDERGVTGRAGLRKEMGRQQRGRESLLTFYFVEDNPVKKDGFPVEKSLAIPVLSSFRVILDRNPDTGKYVWGRDPFLFFDVHGTKLVRETMRVSGEKNGDMHLVGRDREVYRSLYRIAQVAHYSDMLKDAPSAKTGSLFSANR